MTTDIDGDGDDDEDDGKDAEHENQSIQGSVFVRMFYRSWTRLLPNLGFERVRMSLCCKSQWNLVRATLELHGQDTRHLTRASFLSLTMRSRQEAANLENEEIH